MPVNGGLVTTSSSSCSPSSAFSTWKSRMDSSLKATRFTFYIGQLLSKIQSKRSRNKKWALKIHWNQKFKWNSVFDFKIQVGRKKVRSVVYYNTFFIGIKNRRKKFQIRFSSKWSVHHDACAVGFNVCTLITELLDHLLWHNKLFIDILWLSMSISFTLCCLFSLS